jgi:hypothetical protein
MSPIWNSVEGLTSIVTAANWGIVLALLVAFALSIVTVITGHRRDTLQQVANRSQEQQIADANARAADASERAARLEAATEQMKLAQERLRTESLEIRLRLERERRERLRLEERIGPRSLSAVQRMTLVAILAEGRGKNVSLRALNSTPESSSFAQQVRDAFVEAGWQAPPVLHATVRETEALPGLTIVLHSVPNATTMTVRRAFGEAGVAATYRTDQKILADQVLIVVGHKPAL